MMAVNISLGVEKKQDAEEGKNTQEVHDTNADCLAVGIRVILLGRRGVIKKNRAEKACRISAHSYELICQPGCDHLQGCAGFVKTKAPLHENLSTSAVKPVGIKAYAALAMQPVHEKRITQPGKYRRSAACRKLETTGTESMPP